MKEHPLTISCDDPLLDDPACAEADGKAVWEHYLHGTPLDPLIARRVQMRSERIRERVFREHGYLNVAVDLIREGRDEE